MDLSALSQKTKKGRPDRSGRPFIVVAAFAACDLESQALNALERDLALRAPGHDLRPRLETMRHWITSFQLLNNTERILD